MLRCILVVFALLAVLVGNDLSLSEVRAQQLELKQSQSTAGAPARVEDQRGTEQSPIVVKVVPAPKTDAEREQEAKARENIEKSERQKEKSDADLVNYTSKLAFFTQGLFWATCALVLATIVLGVVALFQSRDMRRSTSAAESAAIAANLSAKAAIGSELPIVNLNQLTLLQIAPGGQLSPATLGQLLPVRSMLRVDFKNAGRTAAEAITQSVEWRVMDKLPEIPVYGHFFPYAPSVFFPPNDAKPTVSLQNYMIELTADQLSEIAEKRAFLWVYGNVAFRDVITGDLHEFRYCAKWQTFREASNAPVGFIHDSGTPPEYTKRT